MKQIGSQISTAPKDQSSQTGTQHGEHGSVMPVNFRPIPAPTPQIAKSLSPRALEEHRALIASELKIFFVAAQYWRGNEGAEVEAGVLAYWCDELQDWKREQAVYGLRQWNRDCPRLKATPGDILAILKRIRGQREAERMKAQPTPPEPERAIVTAEQRAAIMAEIRGETP